MISFLLHFEVEERYILLKTCYYNKWTDYILRQHMQRYYVQEISKVTHTLVWNTNCNDFDIYHWSRILNMWCGFSYTFFFLNKI